MPRDCAIAFRDLVGKLDVLSAECDECGRRGRYHVHRLADNLDASNELGDGPNQARRHFPPLFRHNENAPLAGLRAPILNP
jgi:hypothetical protein